MSTHTQVATPSEKSERAPCSAPPRVVVASPGCCPICGRPLRGRQRCCSGRCRAALSRRRRIPVKAEDLRGLRVLVTETVERVSEIKADATAMLDRLWEAKTALERYLNGA